MKWINLWREKRCRLYNLQFDIAIVNLHKRKRKTSGSQGKET